MICNMMLTERISRCDFGVSVKWPPEKQSSQHLTFDIQLYIPGMISYWVYLQTRIMKLDSVKLWCELCCF